MATQFPIINKHGLHDYLVLEKFEAGIVLTGFEAKSLRMRGAILNDSYVRISKDMEAMLLNASIPAFQSGKLNYDDRRERKLLLHAAEIRKLYGRLSQGNYTIIPIKIYLKHHYLKIEIGLAKSKKQFDKRDTLKRKATMREMERELRGKSDK